MSKKPALVCLLLAICLVFFALAPAKAASLQLVPNWGASGVPTNLSMYIYVPDHLAPNPPILVLLHYWGGGAAGVFAEAVNGGIVAAADQYGFIMVVPQNPDCWDVSSTATLTHDGGGQTQGIAQMVKYAINTYQANSNRVYVTGTSCGGEMTEVLCAVYPDIFKAGASFSGQVVGGAWTPVTHTAQEWGNIVRACYPGYSGPRPRVQLWHGTADGIINYSNQIEAIMQWGNVLGLSTNPTTTTTVMIPNITNQWTHQVWKDAGGATLLDAWSEINGPHGTDANLDAQYVIPFLGLDKVGPVDLGSGSQRSRPRLNAARTTFVADDGQDLRGPYTSTEWTSATSWQNIANMKNLGFNAVHLYAESFDMNYPNAGSTAPGYSMANVDAIVAETRTNGLYLIITIGNGANNGNYNAAYITNFWNLYSARYANETHVLFEIQNEPVAWGPPYSSPTATPPGGLDMEVAAYRAIRANAPNTPVLLFTYAVLGGTGGASAALTDIHAFNQTVFGNQNAVWTNTAVGFHGYAGDPNTAIAVSNILNAGYPCFMTEFGTGTWGWTGGGLDVAAVEALESLGVSWVSFQYVPPSGVSDDVTRPDAYVNRVMNSGLSWTPDYGSFPQIRGPYGNGGHPWTAPDYNNNTLGGTLHIEAENFDSGGKGVAYYNTNSSNPGGQYRTSETVGIQATSDTGGGYNVGWTAAGDWLEYTTEIPEPGAYNLRLRVAGASAGSVQVLADDNNLTTNGVDLTGPWALPNTGGAQTWQTVTRSVFLAPGRQKLRINVLAGGFNLNWIELSPATTGPIANGNYKFLNAANDLALDLDTNNNVVTATPSSSNTQQWTIRHIGGGQYEVSSVAKGNSWYTWAAPLHLLPWGWGAGGNTCFILQPTIGGFYRVFDTGGGLPFAPSVSSPPLLDQVVWNGSAAQQWAIVSPTAPVFPTVLSAAAASSTQDLLTWNAVGGASGYNVKRSLTSGGPYTTIATGVTATNYTDTVSPNSKYYYVVSAVVGGVESINSLEATLNLPFPWMTQDVGAVGVAGGAVFSNGVFSVTGSGADIWGTSDAFRFVYVPVTGNCTNIARVVSVQNIDPWSKAGVMIRESLAANAANAFIAVTPGNGVTWQTRSSTGASSGNSAVGGLNAPYWVKLVRIGSTFTGYRSPDGTNWTQLGTATFTMASTAYIGLALTSHNNSSLCMATFDNVTAPGWTYSPAPVPTGLVAAASSTSQINLVWNTLANATSYNVKRSLTNGGPYTVIASGVTATNYPDSGLAGGTMYYYVVSAVVGGTNSADSAQAAAATFSPTLGSLVHRYSFGETGGASIADSVGGPVWSGTLPVGGTLSGGQLALAAASSQYASLPSGVVGSLSNFTVMAWVNLTSVSDWSRIFDFGNDTTTNMFLTPQCGGSGTVRFAITTNGGSNEQQINSSSKLSTGARHQVAVTLNSGTGILYVDGVAVGTNSGMTLNPSSLGSTVNNYLGKSQYPDPYLNGSLDEFRIYNVGLSSAEVAATYALGSGQQLSTNSPAMNMALMGTNLTFSWPLESAGFTVQLRTNLVLGDWQNVTSPAPQIVSNQWQMMLPPATNAGSVYYRLMK